MQVSAANMDTRMLKQRFGKNLSFWGAIDTYDVLPNGTNSDVVAEVRKRITDLGTGGGYVMAPVHDICADVPPENILAMCRARACRPVADSGFPNFVIYDSLNLPDMGVLNGQATSYRVAEPGDRVR